ncbi:paired mesoderm homeobox protein 2B-like [Phacochoerus africanus]|uniref:paired mesoderm homeobox protein 2B-like n=1 Tax=Phacochoerus africanus TaxID=41426 RepID=UPI001FD9357E|nr:paired mesoderm homeobox protein 2B-like [Phacochoerus africanus]
MGTESHDVTIVWESGWLPPARVRTTTPATTREHAEGPNLPPYPSELSPNSSLPLSPRKSSQSNNEAQTVPNPPGPLGSHPHARILLLGRGFPRTPPRSSGPAPRQRGREAGPGARPPGWGRGGGGAAAPGGGSARAREMPVSAARAAAAAAAGEAAAGPGRGAAQGAGA